MVEVRGYINDLIANEEYKDIINGIQDKEGFSHVRVYRKKCPYLQSLYFLGEQPKRCTNSL